MLRQKASSSPEPIADVFVEEALECARQANVDVGAMLRDLGLSKAGLGQLHSSEFARIWLELSVRMQDEFFGLGARPMRPGSFALMGHAVRGARDFGAALRRALRFLKTALDEPFGVLELTETDCIVTLIEINKPRSAFAYRTFFLILHGLNCWLARERIPLKDVRFPCREPNRVSDYGDFFGVPVTFGCECAQIIFDRKYLGKPVRRSERELKAFLRTAPEAFLRGYRDVVGIKRQIIEQCLMGSPQNWPHSSEIARQLGMSRSTLHRRLADTGTSLKGLKDEQRRVRATMLLKTSELSVSDIALDVGYADESTFYRSFYRWYSTTPAMHRRKIKRQY